VGAGAALAAVAAGGFAGAFVGALMDGASVKQAFRAGLVGAFTSFAGSSVGIAGQGMTGKLDTFIFKVGAHGLAGGIAAEIGGGEFRHGFLSSAAAAGIDYSGLANKLPGNGSVAGRTIRAGLVGGTVSAIGGGKFANGAYTAALQHLVNKETSFDEIFESQVAKHKANEYTPKPGASAVETAIGTARTLTGQLLFDYAPGIADNIENWGSYLSNEIGIPMANFGNATIDTLSMGLYNPNLEMPQINMPLIFNLTPYSTQPMPGPYAPSFSEFKVSPSIGGSFSSYTANAGITLKYTSASRNFQIDASLNVDSHRNYKGNVSVKYNLP
jgi:hypothetical protein